MGAGRIVLAVYALLMVAGGVMGYRKAGSKASLIAGIVSGALLYIAFVVVRFDPVAGYWIGALTSLLLSVVFALRLAKSGKVMPSAGLLLVSVTALILLTRFALAAQGKL